MYTVIDLVKNSSRSFASKLEVLYWWRDANPPRWRWNKKFGKPLEHKFDDLNITGKDTRYDNGLNGTQVLRRFIVLDENGYHCDIRNWTDEIKQVDAIRTNDRWQRLYPKADLNLPLFRRAPVDAGSKIHYRGFHGVHMLKQRLIDAEAGYWAPDDYGESWTDYRPIVDHSAPRQTHSLDVRTRSRGSKSWKNMSKSGRQWAKHREGCNKRHMNIGWRSKGVSSQLEDECTKWHIQLLDGCLEYLDMDDKAS